MNKLMRELLYVPKYGKVKEKMLLTRMACSVTVILLCLAAMSFTAYAYFTSSVTSGVNIIKSANFSLDTFINDDPAEANEDGYYALSAGSNLLTLKESDRSNASTGYGKILICSKDDSGYNELLTCYTSPFLHGEDSVISVTFIVPEGTAFYAKVISEWGSCAMPSLLGEGDPEEDVIIDLVDLLDLPEDTAPEASEPVTESSEATDPEASEPVTESSEATEPEASEPVTESSEATEPEASEPVTESSEATEPEASEPVTDDSEATEPEASESETDNSEATEPEASESETEGTEMTDSESSESETEESDETESTGEQYVVQNGDNLYSIAQTYNTTVEILQTYNNIENPRVIMAGQIINIPPADYVLPESTESVDDTNDADTTSETQDPET